MAPPAPCAAPGAVLALTGECLLPVGGSRAKCGRHEGAFIVGLFLEPAGVARDSAVEQVGDEAAVRSLVIRSEPRAQEGGAGVLRPGVGPRREAPGARRRRSGPGGRGGPGAPATPAAGTLDRGVLCRKDTQRVSRSGAALHAIASAVLPIWAVA